ncbi:class I poly(R)-hydroxyalkanoic acid synthase [Burkholderia vietnamiensis]|uniref:class I poly(R)-hydroxyalkanoic acid synthase n=1 Tax=Burkholderia vietnamiensis TaxID=60552 RepID=UPI0007557ED0|nr:class I poly(R)-hydroxyalkanoic acid synthase [Burkholderia vietnamiensis]KVE91386.1 poly-beta-hydroxybutyrate polymerase [Burkholderia vietnamiensis]MBR7916221.1 class I poly(R)-hydroxyalkanoic acid synthase [Burkholderia vietnamiensis]HDR9199878.1 class I poly(R)-hydroxyalkanoic acid synthase [Burkholderia vietnamiensis]
MTASKNSSTSAQAGTSAGSTGFDQAAQPMQQMFESWLNAWRGFADPARVATAASAANPFAAFQFPAALPFQMPAMPDLAGLGNFASPFAGLKLPVAAVPPERLQKLQADYARDCITLMQQASAAKLESPELKDRRFSGDAWKASPAHAFAAAWYLLNARYLQELADALETDPKTRERIRFAVQQWTAAAAPSNFLALNPDAQKSILDTQGESLRQGMMNLLGDMQRGKISQTDESQFVVGKNLGCTEGAVVYENDLIQLIQYNAKADKVFERPLLIVPPCINKFYILDLQPENSLVAHALSSGHQVFLVSWRNADASVAHKTWDDYMNEGLLAAIDAVQQVSGREQINTLGFCVGGTMLATALAVLAARGEHPAASMTLLTAMLDFTDTGILDVFVDEAHVQMREQTIGGKNGTAPGLMRGVEFANTFSFLRPNDLVWNYVVDNYLKGRTPAAFDLLYWNSDSTSLPGPMYAWYLRNTYLENKLREPNALTVCGEPVDLSRIDVPTFIYGSREDHIVPWQTAYASTSILTGPLKFVLGASGHIAGVINPPAKKKRSYWVNDGDLPEAADDWFAGATEQPGSWWTTWVEWLDQYGGRKVAPPAQPGSAQFPVIEPAPGRYVLQRD